MSDIRKYVQLLESSYNQVNNEQTDDDCYLFSYDAEQLYESSGISLDVLMENRIDWLRDNIMHKLEPVADKEGKSVEELFNWIIDQDPSTKKQYSQWLMKILVGKNAQSSLEDIDQASDVLSKYDELKKSKALKPEHKDLNQFKSIDELSKAISSTEQNIKSKYDEIEQRARNESEIIHEDDVWVVVIPKTEYAAGYWGKKSLWCTAAGFEGGRQEGRSNNMFDTYAKQSNLYTIVNKKNPSDIYQIHLHSGQFMDSENKTFGRQEDRKKIIDHFPNLKHMIPNEILESNHPLNMFKKYKNMIGDIQEDFIDKVEDTIATVAEYSYVYAMYTIKGRFKKGEDAIATDAEYSYEYSKNIINGRFEKGEDAIAKVASHSYEYARDIIKGRFEKGEDAIATDSHFSYMYAKNILNGRFEKGESAISTDANASFYYATKVIHARFEKGEDVMYKWISKGQKQEYYKLTDTIETHNESTLLSDNTNYQSDYSLENDTLRINLYDDNQLIAHSEGAVDYDEVVSEILYDYMDEKNIQLSNELYIEYNDYIVKNEDTIDGVFYAMIDFAINNGFDIITTSFMEDDKAERNRGLTNHNFKTYTNSEGDTLYYYITI